MLILEKIEFDITKYGGGFKQFRFPLLIRGHFPKPRHLKVIFFLYVSTQKRESTFLMSLHPIKQPTHYILHTTNHSSYLFGNLKVSWLQYSHHNIHDTSHITHLKSGIKQNISHMIPLLKALGVFGLSLGCVWGVYWVYLGCLRSVSGVTLGCLLGVFGCFCAVSWVYLS